MSLEEAKEAFNKVSNTEDVAEKRFLMFQAFTHILSSMDKDSVTELEGYVYKLSQDFLLDSSTMKKEQKLEKILDYVEE